MSEDESEFRLDKRAFSIVNMHDSPDDLAYWLTQTPDARLRAGEFIRQMVYGYDPATIRLQRVFEAGNVSIRKGFNRTPI
jgi:hypothetical protein